MFIMRLFSMSLVDAFEFVKTQRHATDPNDGFLEQLRIFETTSFAFENESGSKADIKSCQPAVPLKVRHAHSHKLDGSSSHLYDGVKKNKSYVSLSASTDNISQGTPIKIRPTSPSPAKIVSIPKVETKEEEETKDTAIKVEEVKVFDKAILQEKKPTAVATKSNNLTTNIRPKQQPAAQKIFSYQENINSGRKVFNFMSGPGCLPKEVLLQAQSEMLNWHGTGVSVMEMSHNSLEFKAISDGAKISIRQMLDIPDNFSIEFLQGGCQLQFDAICYNLLGEHKAANYLVTGAWSKLAAKEASKHCRVNIVDESDTYTSTRESQWNVDKNADFFHYIDNETADGLEYNDFPYDKVPSHQPLVCDMSSSFLTKPIDWSKYGVVYAAGQKQASISNVTIAVIRNDLFGRHLDSCPTLMSWESHRAAPNSFPNAPNTFGIYMCGLWVDH